MNTEGLFVCTQSRFKGSKFSQAAHTDARAWYFSVATTATKWGAGSVQRTPSLGSVLFFLHLEARGGGPE